MGILRSEDMRHGTLVLPVEQAHAYMDQIGRQVKMQFEDMNAQSMQRQYKRYIQRLDEMDRIIRFIKEEISGVPGCTLSTGRTEDFLHNDLVYKLDDLEAQLKKYNHLFVTFKDNNTTLIEELVAAQEECEVVKLAASALKAGLPLVAETDRNTRLLDDSSTVRTVNEEGLTLSHLAGVIAQSEAQRFAKTLFRATRGNAYVQLNELSSGDQHGGPKAVFVIYFQGGMSSFMCDKITKICQAFSAKLYAWPQSAEQAARRQGELETTIVDKQKALNGYEKLVAEEAQVICRCPRPFSNSRLEEWRMFVKKEKAIYATLNMFEGDLTLRANCWFPDADLDRIKQMLQAESAKHQGSAMLVVDQSMPKGMPPTYIARNDFTGVFQELVDTYGTPRYKEANPMVFTCITFPFIFGIMYGDIGHGALLLLAGLWAMKNASTLKLSGSENMRNLAQARYLLTLMGFFAVYAGFMYNDLFSLGVAVLPSRWAPGAKAGGSVTYDPLFDVTNGDRPEMGGPYAFGVDPAWHGASNELLFLNSMKMKISVLIGVLQMLVGVFLKWSNALHERNLVDFIFECLPQLAFMTCFFGYMDYMIMYKWVYPTEFQPSLINSLICMGLGQPDKAPLFEGSGALGAQLMLITALSVPLMLIPKPLILWLQNRSKGQASYVRMEDAETGQVEETGHGHGEGFDMGEIVIHQTIETIEYVLGTISHTASYLRQWALSLAHQQLSQVFFQKTVLLCFSGGSTIGTAIAVYFATAVWFGITLGVLLGMDVMECFLHTLRLHWVEFQSKFYRADGYAFTPFEHARALKSE